MDGGGGELARGSWFGFAPKSQGVLTAELVGTSWQYNIKRLLVLLSGVASTLFIQIGVSCVVIRLPCREHKSAAAVPYPSHETTTLIDGSQGHRC